MIALWYCVAEGLLARMCILNHRMDLQSDQGFGVPCSFVIFVIDTRIALQHCTSHM